ncbi:MAG: hypothetical protein QXE29_04970 [Candidatus Hadarchaeales archaeon]
MERLREREEEILERVVRKLIEEHPDLLDRVLREVARELEAGKTESYQLGAGEGI